ncbi:hypothetical protein CpsigB_00010 [Corynebacterium pseudotuberculosis]|uniref:Uncharacterized protein n=1 Tax=Corynebacterium pseudotuberculosis (strain C231) TaxID=681645 RepID=A0A6D2LIE5_CORP2|nr:Hypothetical protein CpPAT10_0002 [Corynebacterium pseudotuberculosis PAT10]AFF21168.1 Hypothetical protein CpP54B96_0002 [Corynebacterium pseudotuberculosis P54B96]AFH50911.1 Hypothetical protein Cp267_0002 [Corynebacterium pseudotuberculosis 267]AKC72754.1 Hypothetical protein Cp226_0002 [Corynebacterium pseudotuberculosis]QHI00959.1 hypothetical protein CPC231_00010 [Corynebacterium pseudotuberculosis C231]QHQ71067.1 hypothetical protein CP1002_00010 [Corynebacterium pseudotuberculosis 1
MWIISRGKKLSTGRTCYPPKFHSPLHNSKICNDRRISLSFHRVHRTYCYYQRFTLKGTK